MTKRNSFNLLLLLITTLGLIPRVIFLQSRGSFWFDEVFTLQLSKLPFWEMLHLAATDTLPPLSTILTWASVRVIGDSEILFRLPALLLGTTAIFIIGLIGKKLFDTKTGLLAAAFVAVSPILIYFSTEARSYAPFLFLTTLTLYFFVSEKNKWYWVSGLLLLATHTYAPFVIGSLYLWGLIRHAKQKNWHKNHAILAITYGAWAAYALLPKFPGLITNSWFTQMQPPLLWPAPLAPTIFGTQAALGGTFWVLAAALYGLLIWRVFDWIKEKKQTELMLLIPLLVALVVALLLGPPKWKYFIFITPFASLLVARAITKIKEPFEIIGVSALVIAAGIVSSFHLVTTFRFSWDHAAAFLNEQEANIIVPWAVNALPLEHYYKGAFETIPPKGFADAKLKTLHETSWQWSLPQDHIEQQLALRSASSTELLVVQSNPYVYGVKQWLEEHGWEQQNIHTFDQTKSVVIEEYSILRHPEE